jgi:amidase
VLDPAGQGTAKQVEDGVRKAALALENVGYAVEEVEPPSIDAAAQALVVMLSTPGTRALWQQVMPPWLPAPTRQFMAAFFDAAGNPDAVAAEESFIIRHSVLRSWGEFQETYPLIVAPIATDIPSVAGSDLDEGQVAKDLTTMRMAMAVNALGLPSVAVPVGIQGGLPQAVQVIGPRYREDLCLEAAGMIEDIVGIITPIDPH